MIMGMMSGKPDYWTGLIRIPDESADEQSMARRQSLMNLTTAVSTLVGTPVSCFYARDGAAVVVPADPPHFNAVILEKGEIPSHPFEIKPAARKVLRQIDEQDVDESYEPLDEDED